MAGKKNPGGRPRKYQPKLTEEAVSTIMQYLAIGAHAEIAAMAAGVSHQTLRDWLRDAQAAEDRQNKREALSPREKMLLDFRNRLNKAVAEAELTDIDRIDRSAETVWQAAAWKLERRYSDRWGMRSRATQENLNVNMDDLTNEQLIRIANGEPLSSVLSQPTPAQK